MLNKFILVLAIGIASQYAPGVMESVIENRRIPGKTNYTVPQDLSQYDGFIAMKSCTELGNEYYLRPTGEDEWERFLVVDCSGHKSTSDWMARNNIIVEIDANKAVEWQTVGRGVEIELAKMIEVSRHFLVD